MKNTGYILQVTTVTPNPENHFSLPVFPSPERKEYSRAGSRPHRERGWPSEFVELGLDPVDPAASGGAGFAGVDEFVDGEGFGAGVGGAGAA